MLKRSNIKVGSGQLPTTLPAEAQDLTTQRTQSRRLFIIRSALIVFIVAAIIVIALIPTYLSRQNVGADHQTETTTITVIIATTIATLEATSETTTTATSEASTTVTSEATTTATSEASTTATSEATTTATSEASTTATSEASTTVTSETKTTAITSSTTQQQTTFVVALKDKVVGGYWPSYVNSPIRIRDVDMNYNLIYLFAARPVDHAPNNSGEIYFSVTPGGRNASINLVSDIQYARTVQNRTIILTVGGANSAINFANRTVSQTFLGCVNTLYKNLSGFDGLDWDSFEGSDNPNTVEMIWISQQLKSLYPGFIITVPPAPYSSTDMTFSQAMLQNNALDYVGPQYYDGPNLANESYVVQNIPRWVSLLNTSHVVIGFGVNPNLTNYMNISQAAGTWNNIHNTYPTIRGVFNWDIAMDEQYNWTFAITMGSLV